MTESKTKQGQDRNPPSFCPPLTRVKEAEKHKENGGRKLEVKLEFQGPAPPFCWERGMASSQLGPAFSIHCMREGDLWRGGTTGFKTLAGTATNAGQQDRFL